MTVTNSNPKDIKEIFRLYKLATEYQKVTFPENQWPEFERQLIEKEILENRQFKIMIEGRIACIWAITFSDPEIWEQKTNDPSIYIHRIATNPEFRGNNFVAIIVSWAKKYALSHKKEYIRLDTCGNNTSLINHYKKAGFDFLGIQKLENSRGLPAHYENANVCYFEIKL
jgi:ribosomal protein S18 acetylase RimI-like enzyme